MNFDVHPEELELIEHFLRNEKVCWCLFQMNQSLTNSRIIKALPSLPREA